MAAFDTDPNLMMAQANFNPMLNNPNQEKFLPLSFVLENAIQRAYHELTIMIEMFPATVDSERKVKIVEYAFKTRQLFMRIYALVKFIRSAHINVTNILTFLDQQSFIFVDTADFLFNLAKNKLVNARLPSFSISTSVDVITLGTYPRLPLCIKGRVMPTESITASEKQSTVECLNRIIQCRVALSDIPNQFKNFKIEKGFVIFWVRNEFSIKLTVMGDNFKLPWRLLDLKFLIKDAQNPNQKLVHNLQVQYMSNVVQHRLNTNERPLVDVYKSLHYFAQSLQLEVLFQQMNSLNRITMGRFYKIVEYSSWKKLTVKYWLDYSKNQFDYKFSIIFDENNDYLQTSHYPLLNCKDHQNIDQIFKSDKHLIEKLIHEIIICRCKQRLQEIFSFVSSIKFCKCSYIENKPALKIEFFNAKSDNEILWIYIDYYSGLFQIFLPDDTPQPMKSSIEASINTDIKKLEHSLANFRSWLILRKCKMMASYYGFKCSNDISIISYLNVNLENFYMKLDKIHLFVEMKNQEGTFIMITLRNKEEIMSQKLINWYDNAEIIENENSIGFGYYLLKVSKCKYDGEIDQSKPYFKLISILELKRNNILNLSNFDNNNFTSDMSLGFFENENERQINGMVQNNYLISEFINVLTHVEERLPLLNFIQLLNKKNIVTQSIEFSPKSMFMTCLNLLSMPTFTNADFVATQPTSSPSSSAVSFHTTSLIKYMKSLSSELWGLINSCCIRQKHFKDYLTSTLPLVIHAKFIPMGLLSQFTFILEFTFNKELLMLNTSSTNNSKQGDNLSKKQMDVYSVVIDAKSLDLFYDFVKSEWQSMCQIYKLIKELKQAFSKYSELNKQIKIKKLNFKRIVIAYGANFVYTAHVRWSKELKQYDLILGTNEVKHAKSKYDMPLINYQNLFLNEIKKYFFKSQSIINLMQILNLTCTCSYTLAKIISLPKFYARIIPAYAPNMLTLNSTLCLFPSFNLLTCSLTHLRLIYFSRYCLDVHLKANGLVSIRDGSFYLTDINSGIDEFHPIQFLSTFLNLFMDENVEEILRRRSSLVEDDNPSSPPSISMNNASSASAAGGGPLSNNPASSGAANQQPHQFLPPTSPAVQPKATMISNVPTPSPIRENYFAPSPNSFNFGSPAISHNSPQQQQQPQHSVQQQQPATVPQPVTNIPSLSSQSPGGFMSPAPSNIQHQNYSIQSPAANYNDYSMQSPMAQNQMSTKSPFVSGGPMSNTYPNVPSVGAATYENTNTPQQSQPPVQPQQQQQQQQAPQSSASKASANHFNSYLDDNLTTQLSLINHFHYKKYHQAALPIYLSSIGFIKMVTPDSETLYSPLETFLASNHMRKIIIKNLQNDPNFQVKNAETNTFKSNLVELHFKNEITASYNAFYLQIQPNAELMLQADLLERYFNTKVLAPPYKSNSSSSFFNLLAIQEPKFFKEISQLLEFELNSAIYKQNWRFKFCWQIPSCLVIKPLKPHFASFYQPCSFSFVKRERYYFMVNLINSQRSNFSPSQSVASLYILFTFDPLSNMFQHELFKSLNDPIQLYTFYDNQLTGIINNSIARQQRETNGFSITNIMNDLLNILPPVGQVGIK